MNGGSFGINQRMNLRTAMPLPAQQEDTPSSMGPHPPDDSRRRGNCRTGVDRPLSAYLHCINTMNATIQKWGNSLAVRIPQVIARQIGVTEGDDVQMEVAANTLVLRPARPSYRLGDLVRRIRPENRHGETDWGESVGREAW